MVNLQHLKADSLEDLEASLKKVKVSIVIINVQPFGGKWYANFLVQDLDSAPKLKANVNVTEKTKVLKIKGE